MKIRVSELSGSALDRWVAKAENIELDAEGVAVKQDGIDIYYQMPRYVYSPSTIWIEGGPIIERENITLQSPLFTGDRWSAFIPLKDMHDAGYGSTALEAAMRCYVASKFGGEVEND